MPELPEVEWVARTLRPRLVGRTIVDVEASGVALRRPVDTRRLRAACRGARALAVRRLGKYLLFDLSSSTVLVAHLGMTGRFLVQPGSTPRAKHTHVVLHLDDGNDLRYVDPRRFGVLVPYRAGEEAASPELSILGVDPLAPEFTVEKLAALLGDARRDLKGFLMDQGRIAGLGNIYVCEALFHAGLSPRRRASTVGAARAARLHEAICAVLAASLDNGGTSFSDYVNADGEPGANQDALFVYAREGQPCRRCGRSIRRIVQGARSTFYCTSCQR
jgi:formamidopyrimidine-DNA glycosylase